MSKSHRHHARMKPEDLRAGMMIHGPLWDVPVTLVRFEQVGDKIRLYIRRDNGSIETIRADYTKLEAMYKYDIPHGTPWRARVAVEMLRHKHAQGDGADYGEMDPLPHQIQSIYHITGQYDDIRFLLADEPGAGKTAVASSIIREMRLQGRADRTLVVVPAHLKGQWRAEMKRFAGLKGYIVEGGSVDPSDPWPFDDHDILITSMDYAKRGENRATLAHMELDLVVVDEAHHMNSSGKNVSTRYRLGKTLSNISTHVLFLTATPHRGKPENFRLLLKLLEPALFTDGLTPEEVAARKTPMFLRHLKREMTDMDGNPIFTKRSIRSLTYMMSDPEKEMYGMVSRYVQIQHQRLLDLGERLAPFVLLLIQKRMASSTYALQKTLERRRAKLVDSLNGRNQLDRRPGDEEPDDEEDPEHERWYDMIGGISAARNSEELETEIGELDGLVNAANRAATTKPDKKLERLYNIVDELGPDGKLLIFSEFVDTIDYLKNNLEEPVCRIDGKMKQAQRDKAVREFRDKRRIMLATDAAREGINLQFCHMMVNYDLPWSPIVLEQRMGRLHRYGQKKDVTIRNLIAGDTIEGDVLDRLSDKIKEIEKQYRAVDVIGTILTEVDIEKIMVESVVQGAATDVEGQVRQAREKLDWVQAMLEHTPVDLNAARRTRDEVAGRHIDGKYLVRMMRTVFEGLGGQIRSTTKTTLNVPNKIRGGPFRRKREVIDGPAEQALSRGTKYHKHVEFWIHNNCLSDLRGGSVFAGDEPGHIVFHTTDLKDRSGKTAEVLVQAHHANVDGLVRSVPPDILYELNIVGGNPGLIPETERITDVAHDDAQKRSDQLNNEKKQFWNRRLEAANIGSRLDRLREQQGEAMVGTPEWNGIDEQIRGLKLWRKNMKKRAETDQLYPEEPRLAGWARVIHREQTQDTEVMGMKLSMDRERREGWIPEDVSAKRGIGYDIISCHPDGRERHIEVKARCRAGPIQLTKQEMQTAVNDPHAQLHIHTIRDQTHHTQVIDNPAGLAMTKRQLWEIPKSELDRVGG